MTMRTLRQETGKGDWRIHLVYLAAFLCLGSAGALVGAESGPTSKPPTGTLGRKEALAFEGNKTFTRELIVEGLSAHIDFLLAAHPLAPLPDYLETLRKSVLAGYQRQGFPETTVGTSVAPDGQHVVVQISEGPHFQCGEIQVTGMAAARKEPVTKKVKDALLGLDKPKDTDKSSPFWAKDNPAPFDSAARMRAEAIAVQALAELNYYRPKLKLKTSPNRDRKTADLLVDILDEGIKGAITQIDVEGLAKNSREQLLRYLQLKPGMELQPLTLTTVSNRLWQSGRFLRQELALAPIEQAGQFQLKLKVEELEDAPRLDQEFSHEEKAFLKFGDWLSGWETRPEQLHLSLALTSQWGKVDGNLAFSPKGWAFLVKANPANSPQTVFYGGSFSPDQIGLYSWSGQKLVFARNRGQITSMLHFAPEPSWTAGERMNLQFGGGFDTAAEGRPFVLNVKLAPVALVDTAHHDWTKSAANGIITLSLTNESEKSVTVVKLDSATGQLLQGERRGAEGFIKLAFEPEALPQLCQEIEAASVSFTNKYQADKPVSSYLAFAIGEVLRLPMTGLLTQKAPGSELAQLMQLWAPSVELLAGKWIDWQPIFAPLEQLASNTHSNQQEFTVPLEEVLAQAAAQRDIGALIGILAVNFSEKLWTPDSWPCVLMRESGFILARRGTFSAQELMDLAESEKMGPLACLAATRLMGQVQPRLTGLFAARGVRNLSLSNFLQDCQFLARDGSVGCQVLTNAISALKGIPLPEAQILAKFLKPEQTAFVLDVLQALQQPAHQPLDERLRPAFAKHWETLLKPILLAAFEPTLPLDIEPVTAPGQYARGELFLFGRGVERNFVEAAKWFRRAADQGSGAAQFRLAQIYLQGVPGVRADANEAIRWFKEAVRQNHPHAACALGEVYAEGHGGVRTDRAEAEKWFRQEAAHSCTNAEFNLGLLTMPEGSKKPGPDWAETLQWLHKAADHKDVRAQLALGNVYETTNTNLGLKWYREAAESGLVAAQVRLGDRLSDDFSTTPDYPEAYFWLSRAAAQGDKIAAALAKRVERKLKPDELAKAKRRVARALARQNKD